VFALWSIVCCDFTEVTQNTPYSLSNTGYLPSPYTTNNRSQSKHLILTYLLQCWKPYAVTYVLALLKIGIMVLETCWANGLLINHNCCMKLVSQIILYVQCLSNFVPVVHSVEQKSIGLKFCKSRTGSHVTYSCHHNLSSFTFPIFVHSWRFSVFHSL